MNRHHLMVWDEGEAIGTVVPHRFRHHHADDMGVALVTMTASVDGLLVLLVGDMVVVVVEVVDATK